jgi:CDP-glycerol glycerophosphotransferase
MVAVPRISVVVPIYNVEAYLETCLESLASQTFGDFEALLVDDGSTDESAHIAEEYARRDERFRLIRQANGGLSKARNTGIDAAGGEFLAFLDSDDALPPDAYELLVGALDSTGSDFASGNVERLSQWSRTQSRFLAKTFATTRLKTHVTRFRPLIADRTAWNKLFRRAFWDQHGFRFPEGVVHEDIPITVPAHFLAKSVDVLEDTVYLYRVREDGNLSITQRRLEQKVLLDRLAAVETVSSYLAGHGPRNAKRWYDESVVADDLRLHLNILDRADDDYRELFLDRVNAFLDTTDDGIYDRLLAIDRLKWHLVRRRLMPELLEVLRFQKEDMSSTPPVQVRGSWYGDYPFRTDAALRIPDKVYALDQELPLNPHLEELGLDGGRLRLRGYAYISGVGAPERDSQSFSLTALRPGRLRRLRLRVSGVRLKTSKVQRPEVTASAAQSLRDLSWSGFEATLDPRALRRRGRWTDGIWEVYATAGAGRLTRRRARFALEPGRPIPAVELAASDGVMVRAAASTSGRVTLEVRTRWARLTGHRLHDDGTLELSGELRRLPDADKPRLELRRKSDDKLLRRPLTVDAATSTFTARVPLASLSTGASDGVEEDLEAEQEPDDRAVWELWAVVGDVRVPVSVSADVPGPAWPAGAREVSLFRTRQGEAVLVDREPRPLLTEATWTEDGGLEVAGRLPAEGQPDALVLVSPDSGERYAFPITADGPGRGFTARLTPAAVDSLAGALPLPEGRWHIWARRPGAEPVPAELARELRDRLPLRAVVGHKPFTLGARGDHSPVLLVVRDLDEDERGGYHQRRLRTVAYPAHREQPLRDAVVYVNYGGRQYSDSPRAIHEELVRRGSPLEQLWVVRDGRCRVPDTVTAVREGSREFHEALARARYVVSNDHFPSWFARRPDQLVLQTWHGTPLKRLGLDVSDTRKSRRRFKRGWDDQVRNWQYVLSPNRFSTPILKGAYAIEGEMLETGYPRVDVLAGPDRAERSRRLRARLGIPEGVRTVLYAPTYRDHVVDRRGRYRLDQRLDIERLRAVVGEDTMILYRKHHYIFDAVPATADGFVRDVSSYPDGTELMLAADVLVTDYSSMTVDFANTGRPVLFYTYDLDAYKDEIRGFYLDFVNTVPGPLLRTSDELGEALRDLDAVRTAYAERYEAFRAGFCELDDGRAAARVVDRLFS